MESNEQTMQKTHMSYFQAPSLNRLMDYVNRYNDEHTDSPILKEDIVKVFKINEVFILLYYK